MSEEFLCARCARHTRTCCQDTEIHVTLGDVRRITPHANGADFFEFRHSSNPAYDQREEDPFWHQHVFRSDGTRRLLKQQPGGDCIFLGMQGCVLPSDTRPLICRLYPFDYTSVGLLPVLSKGCPVELLRPGQQLLTALDMRAEDAAPLRDQLYQEICETEDEHPGNQQNAAVSTELPVLSSL